VASLLAATLIVRDEAAVLDACLGSIRDVVDEIVVVDTGSRDESVAIAERHGARVHRHPWSGDFAEARNEALRLASSDWILYIDADERLAPVGRDAVEALLTGAPEVAFRVLLKPDARSTPYLEYRLWRHDPRIRFVGTIHEKVVPAIHAVSEADGRPIGRCDLLLEHVGYEGDQTHKHRRNLPLLRRQLEVEPDNLFNLHHLARVLLGLGEDDEAERVLERAVATARALPFDDPLGSLAFGELLLLRHLRGDDVGELLAEARDRFPDNWLIVFMEARYLVDHERYEEALERFARLLEVDLAALPDAGPAYDERIFGTLAHEGRGACLFRLERYEEAAAAYAAAERCDPADTGYGVRRRLAEARARAVAPPRA
jgi:glycosyltransferase involved in cell wall biosynthesis